MRREPGTPSALTEQNPAHYGWRFAFLDPPAMALFTWGVFSGDVRAVVGGLGAHLVVGPLVHLLSGEWGNAGWSFLARLATTPTVFLFVGSLNLSSGLGCHTEIACRNLVYGLVMTGLVFGWLHDVLNAEHGSPEAMRLWSAAPTVGTSDRGDPTWGLAVRF